MKKLFFFLINFSILFSNTNAEDLELPKNISNQTKQCIGCHKQYTPSIVYDWLKSRHAKTTPEEGIKKPELEKRISAKAVSENLSKVVVGCYECHSLNGDKHEDNFNHFGNKINVVVSPPDCATCHPDEVKQYTGTKKYHAFKNIMKNPVYHALVNTSTGITTYEDGKLMQKSSSESTLHETCLGCHGTEVKVKGFKKIKSLSSGLEITVPDLTNWPNQGVGRINPDGSLGACTSCHPRHEFSIAVARKPYTCAQCHLEPDVPAYNVYKESKHGNIYESVGEHKWDFESVPWKAGKDFTGPTCATCHNSLIVNPNGKIIAERTHDFSSRLWVRLFGLIYTHPQPKSGDTTIIKNADGLPLPVTFTGKLSEEYLISKPEAEGRMMKMKNVCSACHNTDWINGHFAKMDNTIKETDEMTKTATLILVDAWNKGIADNKNPFDEPIERKWIQQWLFYGNSIRYASAMSGAPDYTSFKYGWWELTKNIQEMKAYLDKKDKK